MDERYPRTLDEAVQCILGLLNDREKEALRNSGEDDLIYFHPTLGTLIRNTLRLWDENYELLVVCGSLDADEASMLIVKAVRQALRQDRLK